MPFVSHRRPSGNRQKTRWPASLTWKLFMGAVFTESAEPAVRMKKHDDDVRRVVAGLRGYAAEFARLEDVREDSGAATLAETFERAKEKIDGEEFEERVYVKRKARGVPGRPRVARAAAPAPPRALEEPPVPWEDG